MGPPWRLLPLIVALGWGGCATLPTGPTVLALPGRGRTLEQFAADDLTCRHWAAHRIGLPSTAAAAPTTPIPAPAGAASGPTGVPIRGTPVGLDASRAAVGSLQWQYDIAYEQCMYAQGDQIPVIVQAPRPGTGVPPPPSGAPAPPQ